MTKLTACLIVKNESSILERCLSCLSFADEIIIVDTGSTDATKEIAAKYGTVYDFEWIDDFSSARNYSFSLATGDYILWLDADDVIPTESQNTIKTLELTADAYFLPYVNGGLEYYRERIVKRSCGFQWREPVHECLEVNGNIQYVDIPIEHHPGPKSESRYRNLNIYRKMEEEGKPFSSRALYYYARECKDHGLQCAAIEKYQEFLVRSDGWIEDRIGACIGLSEVYISRGQQEDALGALMRSFCFDLPRPEACCRIANIYFEREDYDKAIWWYHTALDVPKPTAGFIWQDYLGYIPHLQLCVCYDRVGQRDKAIYHNEQARLIKPDDKAVLHNLNYFSS